MERVSIAIVLGILACCIRLAWRAGVEYDQWRFTARAESIVWSPTYRDEDTAVESTWTILTDFKAYGEWNTFTRAVWLSTDGPAPGSPVTLQVALQMPWPLQIVSQPNATTLLTLNFKWISYNQRKHEMCWGISNAMEAYLWWLEYVLDALLISKRCVRVVSVDSNIVVRNSDENIGFLAPIVQVMYQSAIEEGFRKMNADLKGELEKKWPISSRQQVSSSSSS